MDIYAIDFETYYDKDFTIKVQGSARYIEDPRFDAYLLTVAGSNGYRYVGDPAGFDWGMLHDQQVVAHNASFDEHIVNTYFSRFTPYSFDCTADLAAFCALPRSLAGAVKQAFGRIRDKTIRDRAKGVDRKTMSLDPAFQTYALEDATDCLELWVTFSHTWPEKERRLSRLNRRMGWKGLGVDREYLMESNLIIDTAVQDRKHQIPWIGEAALGSPIALAEALISRGIPVPRRTAKNDEKFQQWLEDYGDKAPFVRAVAELRQVRRTQALFDTVAKRTRPDGSFPYDKLYYGGHTGRFSGAGGFNMENLNQKDRFGTNIRRVFIPRKGKLFLIADYSQVEPRCLNYAAGDFEFLELCRQFSPYIAHGIQTGRIKDVEEFNVLREIENTKEAVIYSGLKAEVLLLGYGGGWATFMRNAKGFKLDVDETMAKQTVDRFRASKPKIVAFWKQLEDEFRAWVGTDVYRAPLPSGRCLTYWNPRQETFVKEGKPRIGLVADTVKGGTKSKPGDSKAYVYGGLLAENYTQAFARDIMTDALLRVTDTLPQAPVVLTVHDELLMETRASIAEAMIPAVREVMRADVPWAPGLPLDVGIKTSSFYRK